MIAREDPSLSLRVALAVNDDDRRDIFAGALERWLVSKTFHGPDAVVRAAGYIGCQVNWDVLDEENGTQTASQLRRFTEMRHEIVHRGARPYVRRHHAQSCVDLVTLVARSVNRDAVRLYDE